MSRIKRKLAKERIRNLIFDIIRESPDGIHPTSDDIWRSNYKAEVAGKYETPEYVLDVVKELENKIKTVLTAKCFNSYLGATDTMMGTNYSANLKIPMKLNSVTKDTNVEREIDEKIKNLNGFNNQLAMGDINKIVSSLVVSLINTSEGTGGPTGRDMFEIEIDVNDVFTSESEGKFSPESQIALVSKAITDLKEKTLQSYKNKSDSFYSSLNNESITSMIGHVYTEWRGQSTDTPAMSGLLSTFWSLGMIDFLENPYALTEDYYTAFDDALNAFFLGLWTVADVLDFFTNIFTAGGYATGGIAAVMTLGIFRIWMGVFALSIGFTAGNIIKEEIYYTRLYSILEKIIEKVNMIVYEEISKNSEKLYELKFDEVKNEIKSKLSNIGEDIKTDLYAISQKYRKVAGSLANDGAEVFNDPNNPAYNYSYLQQDFDNSPEFSDEPIDDSYKEDWTEREKQISKFNMASNYDADSLDILDVELDEGDIMTPKEAEIYLRFFQKLSNKDSEIPDMGRELITKSSAVISEYAKALAVGTIDTIAISLEARFTIPIDAKEYIDSVARKINSNKLVIFSDEIYSKWEKYALSDPGIKNLVKKDNNKFNCKVTEAV